MVDLALLQSVSYIAGAIGVCMAALYYIYNMRAATKDRKVAFTTANLSTFSSREGMREYSELMAMQWTDFEDFKSKYDSRVNPENSLKRSYHWNLFDKLGWQLKTGLVDYDTVKTYEGETSVRMWLKFEPIIEAYKREELPSDAYENWEYLAKLMEKAISADDKKKLKHQIESAYRHEKIKGT